MLARENVTPYYPVVEEGQGKRTRTHLATKVTGKLECAATDRPTSRGLLSFYSPEPWIVC